MSEEDEIINIAVCDDENYIHEEIREVLKKYEKEHDIKIKIFNFTNAADLLGFEEVIDILLLDIAMPDMNGLEVGFELRKRNKDYRIIMLTGLKEKAAESLKIGAFRFVEKPIETGEKLFEAIDSALATFIGYKKISVKYKYKAVDIYQYQIDYIKAMGGYVNIHAGKIVYESIKPLKVLKEELDSRMFIQTDKSYIVNMSVINKVGKNSVTLTNGDVIPVSRRMYKYFIEGYSFYDSKGYNGIRNGCFY